MADSKGSNTDLLCKSLAISLGRHCQAAYQLDRLLGRGRPAQFFDWLTTPHQGMLSLLSNRFEGFLAPEAILTRGEHDGFHVVVDGDTGTELIHDFPVGQAIASRLASVQEKYRHLARRFFDLPGGDGCLFIRQAEPEYCLEHHAREIYDALLTIFPAGFRLMMVSELPAEQWSQNVFRMQVHQTNPYIWSGCDESWDAAFQGSGLHQAKSL